MNSIEIDVDLIITRIHYCLQTVTSNNLLNFDKKEAAFCKKILETEFKQSLKYLSTIQLYELLASNIDKFAAKKIGHSGRFLRETTIEGLLMSFCYSIHEVLEEKFGQLKTQYDYQSPDLSFIKFSYLYINCCSRIDLLNEKVEKIIKQNSKFKDLTHEFYDFESNRTEMFHFLKEKEMDVNMEFACSFDQDFNLCLIILNIDQFKKFIEEQFRISQDKEKLFFIFQTKLFNFSQLVGEDFIAQFPSEKSFRMCDYNIYEQDGEIVSAIKLDLIPLEKYLDFLKECIERHVFANELPHCENSNYINIAFACGANDYGIVNSSLLYLKEKGFLLNNHGLLKEFVEGTFHTENEIKKKSQKFSWSENFDEKNLILLFNLWIDRLKINNKSQFCRAMIRNLDMTIQYDSLYSYFKGLGKRPTNKFTLQVNINKIVSQAASTVK